MPRICPTGNLEIVCNAQAEIQPWRNDGRIRPINLEQGGDASCYCASLRTGLQLHCANYPLLSMFRIACINTDDVIDVST